MSAASSGNRVFADDQVEMRSLGGALIECDWCPKGTFAYRDRLISTWRHRRNTTCEPRNTWGYHKLGEGPGTASPSQPSEGTDLTHTLILDFGLQNWRPTDLRSWTHPVCGALLQPLSITNTRGPSKLLSKEVVPICTSVSPSYCSTSSPTLDVFRFGHFLLIWWK